MPNLYATPGELKGAMPDGVRASTSKYDALLMRLAGEASRFIDRWCRRVFYPTLTTRTLAGSGRDELWVDDLLSITSVDYSTDNGQTYTTLAGSDYIASYGGNGGDPRSSTLLTLNVNGSRRTWPEGQRSVRIAGVWAYADDRNAAWEAVGESVQDNPLAIGATVLTVNDVDGLDAFGMGLRLQPGQLLQLESEYVETGLTQDLTANTIIIARGRNGTAAAQHVQNTAISVWRPPEPVKQATIITAVRGFERGSQGFADARADVATGQMLWVKQLDPEAQGLLSPYRKHAVG